MIASVPVVFASFKAARVALDIQDSAKSAVSSKPGVEIIHSDLGDFLKGKQSLLDVQYKVGYEKERDAMINKKKKKGKMKFQSLKVEVKLSNKELERPS